MSDHSGNNFLTNIPLSGLIAVISGVMGTVLLHYEPLVPRRQVDPPKGVIVAANPFKIESSLYEDPFNVIGRLREPVGKSAPNSGPAFRDPSSLFDEALRRAGLNENLLILPVLMKPGTDAVSSENRSRSRLAVIEGLASCGYIPESGKLECCRFPPWIDAATGVAGKMEVEVPLEWFNFSETMPSLPRIRQADSARPRNVLVLWLHGGDFEDTPIMKLRTVLQSTLSKAGSWGIQTIPPDRVQVRVIGPHSTQALAKLVKECGTWPANLPPDAWRHRIDLYSQSATASDEGVLNAAEFKGDSRDLEKIIKPGLGPDAVFKRTIVTDDLVADALVDELKLRGLDLKVSSAWRHSDQIDRRPHVAIISEFDTPYGRELPHSFLKAVYPELPAAKLPGFNTKSSCWHWFSFPRGLDGRTTGGTASTTTSSTASKNSSGGGGESKEYKPDEVPDGTNQADTLRRLAEQMEAIQSELVRKGSGGFLAIGLMGGDVYDKLWLLRAIKPRFPDAIFFTDNLDAWLWQKDELRSTRNLVVASPFALSLGRRLQMGKPPFRDSYQTSTYAATLIALECATFDKPVMNDVRRYEIGLGGPYDLSPKSISKWYPHQPKPWWTKAKATLATIVSITVALIIAFWFCIPWLATRRAIMSDGENERSSSPLRSTMLAIRELLSKAASQYVRKSSVWVPFIALTALAAMHELWRRQGEPGEPLVAWEGISGWPTQGLRIAAILLSVHLSFRAAALLKDNSNMLRKRFFKNDAATEPLEFRHFSKWWHGICAIFVWSTTATRHEAGATVKPDLLWREYGYYNSLTARIVRSILFVTVLMYLLHLLGDVLGTVYPRMRGDFARRWDSRLDFLSSLAFLWITCVVIDALWAGRMFTFWVTQGQTDWTEEQTKPLTDLNLSRKAACDYLDLQLVAERTRPITALAFYPFYVLALLVIARCGCFDQWIWPKGVIAVYGTAILLVLVSAMLLREQAENLRMAAIEHLRGSGPEFTMDANSPKGKLAHEIGAIRKGSFAPFSEQPVMKSIYWLVSALSIGSVWQYLSRLM